MNYREGQCIAVPLRDSGFALGVLARVNPTGVLLVYFFGPRRSAVPDLQGIPALVAEDAVLVAIVSHLGIRQGRWPIVDPLPGFDRPNWPMPVFVRYEELTGRSLRIFYHPDDPNQVIREEPVAPGIAERGPTDELMGAGFLEKRLTAILTEEQSPGRVAGADWPHVRGEATVRSEKQS